ncbi:MAG: undecaprenyl-diphosphatase [Candidatus Krumholzibacteriia bacterium]|jgi:undecaprenyl-diphosphatase
MLVLAFVQGVTEFLPVSSSGHLVLTQTFLGIKEGTIFFDVILHAGTLGSVLVFYRRAIMRLLKFDRAALHYILALVVGSIPAAVVGLLLKDVVTELFKTPVAAAGGLIFTAAILFSTRFSASQKTGVSEPWQPQALTPRQAILIGCGQAFAILPGISRSGSTIAVALWMGVPRAEAARFSFLLSVPVICGALVLQLVSTEISATDWPGVITATVLAFLVGLVALRLTALAVVQAHFWKFSAYCLVVGLVALAFLV